MITRTKDLDTIIKATEEYKDSLYGFYPEEWIKCDSNVALTNEYGDVSFFERELPFVVSGHYFFFSRGKQALTEAKKMLREAFTGPYNIEVIRGLSPLQKLGARWMNKQLGFRSYGVVQTMAGPCELVILTKTEWLEGVK